MSGRVRGRPGPVRGMRCAAITAVNEDASPACPAETVIARGRAWVSLARWTLVLRPPRDRPRAWSAGSPGTGSPFAGSGSVLVGPADGGVHRGGPADVVVGICRVQERGLAYSHGVSAPGAHAVTSASEGSAMTRRACSLHTWPRWISGASRPSPDVEAAHRSSFSRPGRTFQGRGDHPSALGRPGQTVGQVDLPRRGRGRSFMFLRPAGHRLLVVAAELLQPASVATTPHAPGAVRPSDGRLSRAAFQRCAVRRQRPAARWC